MKIPPSRLCPFCELIYTGWTKIVTPFLTTSIQCHINCKTSDIYAVWTFLTFAIIYSQFKCAHLSENIFIILLKPQCFHTCRLWIKQRSSIQHMKLQSHKTTTCYMRRRTTPFNENDIWVDENCKYNASNKRGNSDTKRASLSSRPL